jgi:hypothetical protein
VRFLGLALLAAALRGEPLGSDPTGTISIVGKNVDSSDPKTFGITLFLDSKTWRESETGNMSHFFTKKHGVYIAPAQTKTVYLCNTDTVLDCISKKDQQAGQLRNLVPNSVSSGAHGDGDASASGIEFNWSVP